jgi:hypothetical protein
MMGECRGYRQEEKALAQFEIIKVAQGRDSN